MGEKMKRMFSGQIATKYVYCDKYQECLNIASEKRWHNWSCEKCKLPLPTQESEYIKFKVLNESPQAIQEAFRRMMGISFEELKARLKNTSAKAM